MVVLDYLIFLKLEDLFQFRSPSFYSRDALLHAFLDHVLEGGQLLDISCSRADKHLYDFEQGS